MGRCVIILIKIAIILIIIVASFITHISATLLFLIPFVRVKWLLLLLLPNVYHFNKSHAFESHFFLTTTFTLSSVPAGYSQILKYVLSMGSSSRDREQHPEW